MTITATEFKTNFGKYLNLSKDEDIYITKNGKIVGKYINTNTSPVDEISGILNGVLPKDFKAKDIDGLRAKNKYNL